jgi:hypothetical protein
VLGTLPADATVAVAAITAIGQYFRQRSQLLMDLAP